MAANLSISTISLDIFKITKWLIIKFFPEGIKTIYGEEEWIGKPIAHQWTWYDENYEKTIK